LNSGTGSRSVMLRASVVAAGIIAGAVGGIIRHPFRMTLSACPSSRSARW
jgi:hypothetical protein